MLKMKNKLIKLSGTPLVVHGDPLFVFGRLASREEIEDLDVRSDAGLPETDGEEFLELLSEVK